MKQANDNRIDKIDPAAFQSWLDDNNVTLYDEEQLEEMYRELLDDEPVRIGSLEYSASYVLEQIDPIAYRCGFTDYLDSFPQICHDDLFGGDYLDEGEDEDDLIDRYLEEMEEEEED